MPKNAATKAARLSTAPMMEWTDRHCRYLHRLMSRHVLLYTEMVTAPAIVRGQHSDRLLAFDAAEHPVALQLGGSDPRELALAVRAVRDYGYDEVNLNVGCPSDRVQSGSFGAVLMRSPDLVADCVAAMQVEADVDVTVKCRIGVDEQEPRDVLPAFLEAIANAGITRVTIHARKAWLEGLSPKQNRDVPPLDYALVHEMKRAFPQLHISLNGGVGTLAEALVHLDAGVDGVMIGRAAYHTPSDILLGADQVIFGDKTPRKQAEDVVQEMYPYIEAHLANGGRLNHITRHMMGLFAGRPGARGWRRSLSENAYRDGVGVEALDAALTYVTQQVA